jgi:site-specific DNA recombinase
MLRAALYARVSTQRQEDEETIENQLNEIKETIVKDGNTLLADCEYKDDGWSGAIIERPDLDRMRQDAAENKFEILYVYDRGRLSRQFIPQALLIEELKKTGIIFKSLHDINGETPESQLAGNIMGLFHEYERMKITERFRIGKLNKVRNGKLLGYQAPYGYDYIPIQGKGKEKVNGKFIINKAEAKVVQLIFEWIAIECVSIKEVIRRLYDLGIPPKKGKRDTWSNGPIHRLLKNESYITKHHYYKSESIETKNPMAKTQKKYANRHSTKGSRKVRPKEEWIEVKVPRIVSDELFYKAQAQIKSNGKLSQRCKKNPYLFGGLIKCKCGTARTGEGQNGHFYYRCTDRLLKFPKPRTCFEAGVNVQVLDTVGWAKLVELMTEPKLLSEQLDRYKSEKRISPSLSQKEGLQSELNTLKLEESRCTAAYRKGLSEETYFEQLDEINRRRKSIKFELEQQEVKSNNNFDNLAVEELTEPFKKYLDNLNYKDKLFTVRKIVDKVVATKELVNIWGNIPVYASSLVSGKVEYNDRNSFATEANAPNNDLRVGLNAKHRNCWIAERWKVYAV